MVTRLLGLITWLERTARLLGFAFRLLVTAGVVALLARLFGLVPAELLSVFWLAVGVGLVTVVLPAFVYGYDSRVDDQYQEDVEAARAKRDRGLH